MVHLCKFPLLLFMVRQVFCLFSLAIKTKLFMSLQFLHPEILWALTALLIPIIIHLFNFKRFQKVYFSNLKFLKDLSIESKRRSKLKKWLILLLRLLALACIIIAFSQPYIPENQNVQNIQSENESVSIYIDNSFSMNGETEKGNALEVAKNYAFDLISSLPDFAKIRVYSNDFSHFSGSLNKKQAIARVLEITPSPVPVSLSDQIKKISLDKAENINRLYVFSDFQKEQSDFENIRNDSLMPVTLVPLLIQASNNLLLDSCWFEKPYQEIKQTQELFVKIRNTSNQNYQKIPIQLSINDSLKSVTNFDIEALASQVVKLRYVNHRDGIYFGKVEINDFPITYDNTLFFSYQINSNIRILSINQHTPNTYLGKLFATSDQFKFKNIAKSQVFNENLDNYQLLVLNELEEIESGLSQILINYLNDGGQVLCIPGEKIENSVNSFLGSISAPLYQALDSTKQRLSNIELNSEIYQNVFEEIQNDARLPDIFKHYKLNIPKNNLAEEIWKTAGGNNLLTKLNYGNGQFFQLAMNLKANWTNLVTHPVFVPTMVNLTRAIGSNENLYYILGENKAIKTYRQSISNDKGQFHIVNENLQTDIIPEQINHFDKGVLLYPRDQIKQSGKYFITQNDSILSACSFNYSRKESIPEYYSKEEIEAKVRNNKLNINTISSSKMKLSELYHEQRDGRQYWKFFVLLCILFFASESIIQRLHFPTPYKQS